LPGGIRDTPIALFYRAST
jgi:hypothetical protein